MTRHRFLNDGRSPIPMGSSAEYACVCGKRGSFTAVEQHIRDQLHRAETSDEEFGGGDTQAHYVPIEPRKPAPTGEAPPLMREPRPGTPEPLPPPPEVSCSSANSADPVGKEPIPRSIAELFQAMLRIAYAAGAASASTQETFETWYQREVLQ